MVYSMLLCIITFWATKHIVAKDLAFSSPLNNPPRGTHSIFKGVASENHYPLEGQVEEKDENANIIEVISLHTQYGSQHRKNKQEIKRERVQCW